MTTVKVVFLLHFVGQIPDYVAHAPLSVCFYSVEYLHYLIYANELSDIVAPSFWTIHGSDLKILCFLCFLMRIATRFVT